MFKNSWSLFCSLFAFVALMGAASPAEAATWSLADDFSLAANPNGVWSYQLEDDAPDSGTYTPLSVNTRTALDVWGTNFPTSPTMWSDATGYWGAGKNTTGVTQNFNTISWAPGEILFHPKSGVAPDTFPARLVFSWEAPSDMTINVDYAYSSATSGLEFGDGVGLSIVHASGLSTPSLLGFNNPGAGGASDSILGLNVLAGDVLHFRFDNWANATGDIYRASIEINQVPEPAAFSTCLVAGLLGLLGYCWCKRR